ncbi:MAG: hypothetical protein EBR47_06305 [Betaproteobacteria bacterium]|nr:hypothetical protein [Betaproteobacteria bacterium]
MGDIPLRQLRPSAGNGITVLFGLAGLSPPNCIKRTLRRVDAHPISQITDQTHGYELVNMLLLAKSSLLLPP